MICPNCGSIIEDGSMFCGECGCQIPAEAAAQAAEETTQSLFCGECGAPLAPGTRFCRNCGAPVEAEPIVQQTVTSTAKQYASQAGAAAMQQVSDFFTGEASNLPGEVDAGTFGDAVTNIAGMAGQGMSYAKGIAGAAKGTAGAKDGKAKFRTGWALLSAVLLAVFWIVQMIWIRDDVDNPFAKFTEWLTFAQGGLGRGALGFVGGIIGKGTVAAALAGLVGGGVSALVSGFKNTFSGANFQKNTMGLMLTGIGVSLMLYQAFTGDGALAGAMAAISGMLVAARSLGGRAGLIFGFARNLTAKKTGTVRQIRNASLTALIGGLTMGFALAVPLAAIPFEWTHLLLGLILTTAGLILAVLFGNSNMTEAL